MNLSLTQYINCINLQSNVNKNNLLYIVTLLYSIKRQLEKGTVKANQTDSTDYQDV